MIEDKEVCDCAARGVPEGYICGKPECPRVQAAAANMRKVLARILEEPAQKAEGNAT